MKNLELMTPEELLSIKGGMWVYVEGQWFWVGDRSLHPEKEDE